MSPEALAEMNCKQFVELVTDYLENQLEAAQREAVAHHHSICPSCQNYMTQMEATIGALRNLASDDVPPQMRDSILAAFRELRPPPLAPGS